jgi:hypothetical protein
MNHVETRQEKRSFEDWLAALEAYKQHHGHCNVPQRHPGGLGVWVRDQRQLAKRAGYPESQSERLTALGFVWCIHEAEFNENLEQLIAFRTEHGHCRVPAKHPAGLGMWVANQRQRAKRAGYPEDRRARLGSLGFDWAPPKGRPSAAAGGDRTTCDLT